MATIKTAIALYDGVTSPLKSMHKAMSVVIDSFESMQRTSGKAVDTKAIQAAREELARAGTAFDSIEESIRNADTQQQRFNGSIRGGSAAADGLWGKLKGIAATVGGLAAAKNIVGLSDSLASTKARLNLIVDDGGSVAGLEKDIMASAQRSRAAYFDTASAIASMGANAKAAFSGNDELIGFMEQINKQFVIGGASAQGQAAAMLQLTQAMGAGALRGEELNSILENAPGIARAIESYMGAAEGSIKKYAEEGQITAAVVKNAMFAAAEETNAKFESMPKTWSQVWTSMQNKALSVFSPILDRINQIANSAQFETVVNGLINGLAAVASAAAMIFDLLIGGASLVAENWSWIAPVVLGVAGAYLTLQGFLAAYNIVQGISNTLAGISAARSAIKSGATLAEAAATTTAAGAQAGLNAALLACPITWIVIGIIALIALFYGAVAAVNHFAGTTYSATGMICGAFMAALAFIGNLFIDFYNFLLLPVVVAIWNVFADVANFLANVFIDPVGAVARLFFDLCDSVLSVVETIASAIDAVFGSDLASSVQGWRNNLDNWVDKTFGRGEEVMSKINGKDLLIDRIDYGEAFDMGYDFGKGVEDKVSGLFDFSGKDNLGAGMDDQEASSPFGVGDTLDGVYGNTGDTAANTARMADSLDSSQEELKLLREIAERQAINKFTTAEVKLDFTGMTNKIEGGEDIDGFLSQFTVKLEDALYSVAEGVHV